MGIRMGNFIWKILTFISVVGQADPITVLLDRHTDEQIVLLKLTLQIHCSTHMCFKWWRRFCKALSLVPFSTSYCWAWPYVEVNGRWWGTVSCHLAKKPWWEESLAALGHQRVPLIAQFRNANWSSSPAVESPPSYGCTKGPEWPWAASPGASTPHTHGLRSPFKSSPGCLVLHWAL